MRGSSSDENDVAALVALGGKDGVVVVPIYSDNSEEIGALPLDAIRE